MVISTVDYPYTVGLMSIGDNDVFENIFFKPHNFQRLVGFRRGLAGLGGVIIELNTHQV
jgi:hypothetical protein